MKSVFHWWSFLMPCWLCSGCSSIADVMKLYLFFSAVKLCQNTIIDCFSICNKNASLPAKTEKFFVRAEKKKVL